MFQSSIHPDVFAKNFDPSNPRFIFLLDTKLCVKLQVTPLNDFRNGSEPLHAKQTFGSLIKGLRLEKTDYSLRRLAAMLGISPAYLSRLESDRDPPPSEGIIVKLAAALGADKDELLSQAGKVSPDLSQFIKDNPKTIPSFLRMARDRELADDDWIKVNEFIEQKKLGEKRK